MKLFLISNGQKEARSAIRFTHLKDSAQMTLIETDIKWILSLEAAAFYRFIYFHLEEINSLPFFSKKSAKILLICVIRVLSKKRVEVLSVLHILKIAHR